MSELGIVGCFALLAVLFSAGSAYAGQGSAGLRARDLGVEVGVMVTGPANAISDVPGVAVGHQTIIRGDNVRTGVTALLPHTGNIFREKVPAAIFVGNGYGKLAGYTQVEELGNIETPIILTNTLSIGTAVNATVQYTLSRPGNEDVLSVNAVVGETNDGYLNDIRGCHVMEQDVLEAISKATSGPVKEGNVGAGTGTRVFGFKGGIGTASRIVPVEGGDSLILGVLVQTNYGGMLDVNGAPVGREMRQLSRDGMTETGDGSCMIVVATDAPLSSRNLKRLAGRALHGLARTGSSMSNGSGDYVIAFSTAYRIPHGSKKPLGPPPLIPNDAMSPFFRAVIEATQEAVYNSMFMAETMTGYQRHVVPAIDVDRVIEICKKYNVLHLQERLD